MKIFYKKTTSRHRDYYFCGVRFLRLSKYTNRQLHDEIEDVFREKNVNMTLEEFKSVFAAWAMEIMTSEYAVGADISDTVRRNLTVYRQRMGVDN